MSVVCCASIPMVKMTSRRVGGLLGSIRLGICYFVVSSRSGVGEGTVAMSGMDRSFTAFWRSGVYNPNPKQ